MLNPLKWGRVDRLVVCSASQPALETCGSTYLAHSSARSLWAGGSIIIGLLGSLNEPMEVTVKLRLLLTSALFLFAQTPTMQAQETLDLAKITCDQMQGEKLAYISRDVVLLLAGYYNGKRNNTIIEPQTIKKHVEEVESYCDKHGQTTVMDAVKIVLGLDK